ncbi:MAG: CinA family protein, partial [Pacificibacter sp.]
KEFIEKHRVVSPEVAQQMAINARAIMQTDYAVYAEGDEGFEDKYIEMLKAGGSKHHKELLAPFGLDASDPTFWDKGLSMISGFIDELEAMED